MRYIIKIIRYILIIYLLTYVVLTILNQFDLLTEWLKAKFTPIDIVHKIRNSEPLGLKGDYHPFCKL